MADELSPQEKLKHNFEELISQMNRPYRLANAMFDKFGNGWQLEHQGLVAYGDTPAMFGVVFDFWETHEFTLWLDGIRYERFDDYLPWYSTVCDDALYGWQNGQAYLSFSRRAVNRQEAIRSAREHAEMGFGVRVSGVSDD